MNYLPYYCWTWIIFLHAHLQVWVKFHLYQFSRLEEVALTGNMDRQAEYYVPPKKRCLRKVK